MKKFRVGIVPIVLVLVALPLFAGNEPSTNGGFHFEGPGGKVNVEFNAKMKSGVADGKIKMTTTVDLPDQDVDGDGSGSGAESIDVDVEIEVDCLSVKDNRASLSGKVVDSSVASYFGKRAILAVEDNGEGSRDPDDRFTWGLYGTQELTWVASDAELEVDEGIGLTWLATDAEREDDIGIPSNASTVVDCKSFPFGAYALEALPQGSGNVQVKP